MEDIGSAVEFGEEVRLKKESRLNRILKITNVILSVLYMLFGWVFSLVGVMAFSLGFSDLFRTILGVFTALLLILIPVFCVLAIVFSASYRKKKNFAASFWVQFFPFGILGLAVITFFIAFV